MIVHRRVSVVSYIGPKRFFFILSKSLKKNHLDGCNFACISNIPTIHSVIETLWHGLCFHMLGHKTDILSEMSHFIWI